MALIANKRGAAARAYIQANFWPITLITWKAFPLIQLFALRFLPAPLWTPFFNLIGFLFGIYVNVKANSAGGGGSSRQKK